MALSNEDYKDVSRRMGKGTAKKVRKATYDADDWSRKNLGKPSNAKSKALKGRLDRASGARDVTKHYKKLNPKSIATGVHDVMRKD